MAPPQLSAVGYNLLVFAKAASAADISPGTLCDHAIAAAEKRLHLPKGILAAVGRVESGRPDHVGRLHPWPYTYEVEKITLQEIDAAGYRVTMPEPMQLPAFPQDAGPLQLTLVSGRNGGNSVGHFSSGCHSQHRQPRAAPAARGFIR